MMMTVEETRWSSRGDAAWAESRQGLGRDLVFAALPCSLPPTSSINILQFSRRFTDACDEIPR
jgi:hypothetical protein